MKHLKKYSQHLLSITAIILIFGLALYYAQSLTESSAVQSLVQKFGYLGVLLTGIVAGLNTFIPVPAATFAPVFIAAGLSVPGIIFVLAVGTLIADLIGYALGHVSREIIEEKYPKIFNFITEIQAKHSVFIVPFVAFYAAFVPFPNEAILIPLALVGIRLKSLIIPLIVGNIIHQMLLIYGISTILNWFA